MTTIDQAMNLLMERAASNLTADDLEKLAGAKSDAGLMAQNLTEVCDRLGSLVADDEEGGWFSDREGVAALLWTIARQTDAIGALVKLGTKASDIQRLAGNRAAAKGGHHG